MEVLREGIKEKVTFGQRFEQGQGMFVVLGKEQSMHTKQQVQNPRGSSVPNLIEKQEANLARAE